MICAAVDLNGFIVATAEIYPSCAEFVLVTAGQADRLTFWADLAIELDPSGSAFAVLLGSLFAATGVAVGLRMVVHVLIASFEDT